MLVADDGDIAFGPELPFPVRMDEFPEEDPLFCVEAVDFAVSKLARRTLISVVLPDTLGTTFHGIGCATDSVEVLHSPRRLLPPFRPEKSSCSFTVPTHARRAWLARKSRLAEDAQYC